MARSVRRLGREDSETRAVLLDVTEQIMREEGYAAVTSRRVAARAGMKPSLVHYYFRTLDDLFLALLRDRGRKNFERYERVPASDQPLRQLWELSCDPTIATSMIEFMALANHRKAIREEIARYGERLRQIQVDILSRVIQDCEIEEEVWPAVVIAACMEGISRGLAMEGALGISTGHRETVALIERYLQKFDGRSRKPPAQSPAL